MESNDLLVTLAEIAGVFVGFGALISVRGGGPGDAGEVTMIRSVLSFGIWVVVAGLTPVVLAGYDIGGHERWLACGLVALVVFWGSLAVSARTPEHRAEATRATRADVALILVGFWSFVIVITGALVLVVLGLFPDQEPALYLTAVVAGVFAAAAILFMLVFSQGHSVTAMDEAKRPSAGGSST